jgi:hypothetical protein
MIHVIVPGYPLTQFLFEPLRNQDDIRIIDHRLQRATPKRQLLRLAELGLGPWLSHSWCFDPDYVAQLRSIPASDTVLLFALENLKELQLMRRFIRARRVHQWIWNPVGSFRKSPLSQAFYRAWLRRAGISSSTFDPADAKRLGFQWRDQVYRQVDAEPDTPAGDGHEVSFIGIDKGRLPALETWRHRLQAEGFRCGFHIVRDKRRRYAPEALRLTTDRWLPYRECLALMQRSGCLLELVQADQQGMSLRCLEAAFLNKKLITNNPVILDTPLYRPERVFVIGRDDPARLGAFLRGRHTPLDPEALKRYDIRHWIHQWEQ